MENYRFIGYRCRLLVHNFFFVFYFILFFGCDRRIRAHISQKGGPNIVPKTIIRKCHRQMYLIGWGSDQFLINLRGSDLHHKFRFYQYMMSITLRQKISLTFMNVITSLIITHIYMKWEYRDQLVTAKLILELLPVFLIENDD